MRLVGASGARPLRIYTGAEAIKMQRVWMFFNGLEQIWIDELQVFIYSISHTAAIRLSHLAKSNTLLLLATILQFTQKSFVSVRPKARTNQNPLLPWLWFFSMSPSLDSLWQEFDGQMVHPISCCIFFQAPALFQTASLMSLCDHLVGLVTEIK